MASRESIERDILTKAGLSNIEQPKIDNTEFKNLVDLLPAQTLDVGNKVEGLDISKFTPYLGEAYNPLTDVETRRAQAQSTGAKILGTLNKAIIGEIVGGTLEGFGHFADIPQTINALEGETQEWGNWLTDLGQDMRTWAEETTPVYTDPANQGKFNPWTADWWYNNAPSMASTLSLMIPSAGIVRGVSMLGKMTKLSKALGLIDDLGRLTKTGMRVKGVGQAVASRLMENGMEALGNYDQTLLTAKNQLTQKYQQQITDEINNLPMVPQYNEEGVVVGYTKDTESVQQAWRQRIENEAKQIASEAATRTWKANWAMLAQDIPQYLLLNNAFPKAKGKLTWGTAKATGKSILKPAVTKAQAVGLDMLGEGGEEAYQYIVNEESRYLAEVNAGLRDESDFSGRLSEYLKDGEFWTSATMGALGAGVMQVGGKSLNSAITRLKGQETKEQQRINNIKGWATQRRYWADKIKEAQETGDVQGEATARSGLSRTMFIQAAQNENLGSLRDSFEILANQDELDENTAKLLDITEEEFPEVKANAKEYIKQIDKIEKLYDTNIQKLSPDLAAELTNRQVLLDDLIARRDVLEPEIAKLAEDHKDLGNLSSKGEAIFTYELTKRTNNRAIELANRRLEKDKNLSEEDAANIKAEIQELTEANKKIDSLITEERKDYDSKVKFKDNKIINQLRTKKIDNDLTLELIQKNLQKYYIDETIKDTKNRILQYQSKKFQQKFEEAKKQKDIKDLKDAIDYALTPEEVSEVKNAAEGTEAETPVKTKVTNKAKGENPKYPSDEDLKKADEAAKKLKKRVRRKAIS